MTGRRYLIASTLQVVLPAAIALVMVAGSAACVRSSGLGAVAVKESVEVMTCSQLPPSHSEAELRACCEGEMVLWEGPVPGLAREISGRFPKIAARDAREAYEVLLGLRDVFGISSTEFALQQEERIEGSGVSYTFVQALHGVPIEDGTFLVSTDSDGTLLMVHGSYVDCGEIAVEPLISSEEALDAARNAAPGMPTRCDLKVVVAPDVEPRPEGPGSFRLAWCIEMQGKRAIDACCVVVDAQGGDVLEVRALSNT